MSDAEGEEGAEGEGEEEKKEEAPKAPKPPSETQTKLADQAKYIAGKFETLFATTGKIQADITALDGTIKGNQEVLMKKLEETDGKIKEQFDGLQKRVEAIEKQHADEMAAEEAAKKAKEEAAAPAPPPLHRHQRKSFQQANTAETSSIAPIVYFAVTGRLEKARAFHNILPEFQLRRNIQSVSNSHDGPSSGLALADKYNTACKYRTLNFLKHIAGQVQICDERRAVCTLYIVASSSLAVAWIPVWLPHT